MKPDFFIDNMKPIETQQPDETLHQHDVDIQQIETRLNSLENLVDSIQQKQPKLVYNLCVSFFYIYMFLYICSFLFSLSCLL